MLPVKGVIRWLVYLATGLVWSSNVQSQSFGQLLGNATIAPADPHLISKLAKGDVSSIGRTTEHNHDLIAVIMGLSNAGCQYQPRRGEPNVDPTQVISQAIASGAILVQLRRVYSDALFEVQKNGCDSDRIHVIARTAMLAITSKPGRASTNTKQESESPPLISKRVGLWSNIWAGTNPTSPQHEEAFGSRRILVCSYSGSYAPLQRIAWYDAPPAGWRRIRDSAPGNTIAEIGPLQLKECPEDLAAYEAEQERANK